MPLGALSTFLAQQMRFFTSPLAAAVVGNTFSSVPSNATAASFILSCFPHRSAVYVPLSTATFSTSNPSRSLTSSASITKSPNAGAYISEDISSQVVPSLLPIQALNTLAITPPSSTTLQAFILPSAIALPIA